MWNWLKRALAGLRELLDGFEPETRPVRTDARKDMLSFALGTMSEEIFEAASKVTSEDDLQTLAKVLVEIGLKSRRLFILIVSAGLDAHQPGTKMLEDYLLELDVIRRMAEQNLMEYSDIRDMALGLSKRIKQSAKEL